MSTLGRSGSQSREGGEHIPRAGPNRARVDPQRRRFKAAADSSAGGAGGAGGHSRQPQVGRGGHGR
eukprot:1737573-Pyramimonas_sp.AAC.2